MSDSSDNSSGPAEEKSFSVSKPKVRKELSVRDIGTRKASVVRKENLDSSFEKLAKEVMGEEINEILSPVPRLNSIVS